MTARLIRMAMATLSLVVLLGLCLLRVPDGQVRLRPMSAVPQPVRIVRFYATAGTLIFGQKAKLCYSVENAKVIQISPWVESAYPSPGRCIEIHPEHTTHYTLQAEGFDGSTAVRSITLAVQAEPLFAAPAQYVAEVRPLR